VSGIADVVYCSGTAENGYAAVIPYLKEGKTVVFTGSSGVGKSTLINRLMGKEILAVNAISGGGRGRHTTTTRQMLLLPSGGIVIDTPGIRELQLAGDPASAFEDIESLAAGCKFRNCTHTAEPGCAVQEAVKSGKLPQERLNNYRKLLKETGYEGLSAKELEHKKIENMFGSMGEMKRMFKDIKNKR
jgi:ribosome biogenesis GTPase